MRGDEAERFASGELQLRSEKTACLPAALEVLEGAEHEVRITLREGRYHQVRRMVAACGNLALAVHRERVGPVVGEDLAPGAWRHLSADEVRALRGKGGKHRRPAPCAPAAAEGAAQ